MIESLSTSIVGEIIKNKKMADSLRREVLHQFKKLHRTRLNKFAGDEYALGVVRNKINEEYKKYKNVTNQAAIEELNKFAQEVEHEVRTTIVQAVEKKPGIFELRLTADTVLVDNVPYNNLADRNQIRNKKSKKELQKDEQNLK